MKRQQRLPQRDNTNSDLSLSRRNRKQIQPVERRCEEVFATLRLHKRVGASEREGIELKLIAVRLFGGNRHA